LIPTCSLQVDGPKQSGQLGKQVVGISSSHEVDFGNLHLPLQQKYDYFPQASSS